MNRSIRKFCQETYILIILLLLSLCSKSSVGQTIYPKVRLSAFKFINSQDHSDLEAEITPERNIFKIPKTFKKLEFTCCSSYPTEWIFRNPLVDAKDVKSINITKSRNLAESSQCIFESVLSLRFKYSTSVPQFGCKSINSITELRNTTHKHFRSHMDLPNTYLNTYIEQNFTEDLTVFRFRGKQPTNDLCEYQLQFLEGIKQFKCVNWITGSVHSGLPVRFIVASSLDESNQQFKLDGNDCADETMGIDLTTLSKLQGLTGSGLITCAKENSLSPKFYYFKNRTTTAVLVYNPISPTNQIYSELYDVLIIEFGAEDIFMNQEVEFTCTSPSLFFSKGIIWSFTPKNDSSNITPDLITEYYEDGAVISKARVHFRTLEAVKISCHAPVVNSRKWVNKTIEKKPQEGEPPKISSLTHKMVLIGDEKEEYHEMTCNASGKPDPQFYWFFSQLNWTAMDKIVTPQQAKIIGCTGLSRCFEIRTIGSNSTLRVVHKDRNKDWSVKRMNITCQVVNIFGSDERTEHPYEFSWFKIMWGLLIGAIIIVLIVTGAFAYYKYNLRNPPELTEAEVDRFVKGEPPSKDPWLLPYDTKYEISKEKFQIENTILGQGISGVVKIGKYGSKIVAIKTTKTPTDGHYFYAMLKELKVLCYLGSHDNIVSLIGACTGNIRKKEVFIMLEFCSNGSMLEYIKSYRCTFLDRYHPDECRRYVNTTNKTFKDLNLNSYVQYQNGVSKNLSTTDLLRWASQIADGCAYLTARKVVHGDLAARNVLITDSLQAKIGDFGLSKELLNYSIYVQNKNCPLPLKWMAIESLQDFEFSIQSDVWSYGITLWELFSLGDSPYPGIDWNFESFKLLQSGYRMEKPKYADAKTYDIMLQCWNENPKTRPLFAHLREFFRNEKNNVSI